MTQVQFAAALVVQIRKSIADALGPVQARLTAAEGRNAELTGQLGRVEQKLSAATKALAALARRTTT